MGFFGLLFVILLVVILFGITMLHGVIRLIIDSVMSLFGISRRKYGTRKRSEESRFGTGFQDHTGATSAPRKKIFAKDEGEYVDFEEIEDP